MCRVSFLAGFSTVPRRRRVICIHFCRVLREKTRLIYVIHHGDRFLALVFLSNLFYHHAVMLLKVGAIFSRLVVCPRSLKTEKRQ